ncbi:MAG: hypothetical protein Q9166_006164 [cf. Caloplaca sp. 2 TL-2023]
MTTPGALQNSDDHEDWDNEEPLLDSLQRSPRSGYRDAMPDRRRINTRENSQTPSKNLSLLQKAHPVFERCGNVNRIVALNNTFELMQEHVDTTVDKGLIYGFSSVDQPKYIKIGLTKQPIQKRGKQIIRCACDINPLQVENIICQVHLHKRLEKIILKSLEPQRCKFTCDKCGSSEKVGRQKPTVHGEWFQIDANVAAEHVEQWRRWMLSEPYDENGRLYPRWVDRIEFFTSSGRRFLSQESCPYRTWSIFLEPPLRVYLEEKFYQAFLCRRGKWPCRWASIRENWTRIGRIAMLWFGPGAGMSLILIGNYWTLYFLLVLSVILGSLSV